MHMMETLTECVESSPRGTQLESAQMLASFQKVLTDRALTPLYQPIVDLQFGRIIGYEGLIRGPSDSPLHAPTRLFGLARQHGQTLELERICRRIHIEKFQALGLAGKLFLTMSPDALLMPARELQGCLAHM